MKSIYVKQQWPDDLQIMDFGTEDISEKAHWGKGARQVYILHYVLSGEGYYNGCRVKEGQGFWIVPGAVHEYHSSQEKPWKYFWVMLSGPAAEQVQSQYIPVDKNGIFDYDFQRELQNFCHKFFAAYETITQAKANGVFWLLMSYHQKEQQLEGNKHVQAAKKYMQQNSYRPISVCQVAQALHLSDRYLYNLFVKFEGMSPKQYLNQQKLQMACDLLKTTQLSITEIAVSVGFLDVLTFSRFFKGKMGISATAYREKQTQTE